jgi:predicted GIY-YIG superfamily endonuclease
MPCKICKLSGHNSRTCKSEVEIPINEEKKTINEEKKPINEEKKHYCYILQQTNPRTKNLLNYIGYTVNFNRRIRQHNGIIKGGAHYTKNRGPWEFLAILHCSSWNNIRGLQTEWLLKHPNRKRKRDKRFSGSLGKINSLFDVCQRIPVDEKIEIFVHSQYYDVALGIILPQNIKILPISVLI